MIGPWVSLFEIYCQLRGLKQSLMDLLEAPELVEAILDRVESIQISTGKAKCRRFPQEEYDLK